MVTLARGEEWGFGVDYRYSIEPFDHQKRIFQKARDLSVYGLWWEQGTGKTKETIDELCWQYLQGKINAVLVLSPNDIRYVWEREFLKHASPDVTLRTFVLSTGDYAKKKFPALWQTFTCRTTKVEALLVLSMSYDTFTTKNGNKIATTFLAKNKAAFVIDEATRIKTPTAQRTKAVIKSRDAAVTRRALTGTLIENSPFDAYAPIKFLDNDFWKRKGISSYTAFKQRFAKWERCYDGRRGHFFDKLLGYKNLDELKALIAEIGSRETKDSAGLNLPPKVYTTVPFRMTPAQTIAYRDLEHEFLTYLSSGEMIAAPLALTRLLRLQQITCGYVGGGDENKLIGLHPQGEKNPRLEALMGVIEECSGQCIIWARFHRDMDLIIDALGKRSSIRYDGTVDKETRRGIEEAFQRGDAQFLCANPATAGEGLTLTAAHTVVFYNNSFRLSHRAQAEDRTHRIGQKQSVLYTDICAMGTVDEKIVEALLAKQEIADFLMGDKAKQWLSLA